MIVLRITGRKRIGKILSPALSKGEGDKLNKKILENKIFSALLPFEKKIINQLH
jgi:hypothetical protein